MGDRARDGGGIRDAGRRVIGIWFGPQARSPSQASGEILEDGDQLRGIRRARRADRKAMIPEAGDMGYRPHPVADVQEQLGRTQQEVAEQLAIIALDKAGIGVV
jgi:hypothetical protein